MTALVVYRFRPPSRILEVVDDTSRFGAERALVVAVIKCESGFNEYASSAKGARGLMQLTDKTFDYIVDYNGLGFDSVFDPYENVAAGRAYLDYLFARFDGLDEVLCAYNAGEGRTRSWLDDTLYSDDGRKIKSIPFKETAKYVKKVKTYYYFYKGAGI